jgi:hypothetical protein
MFFCAQAKSQRIVKVEFVSLWSPALTTRHTGADLKIGGLLGMSILRRKVPPACLWLCALLLGFLLSTCSRNDGESVLGSVFQVHGTAVASKRTEADRPRPLSAGSQFAAGDDIRFLADSSGTLCLTPGIYLRCFGPSRLQIEDLRVSKDGDETGNAMKSRLATIRLGEGRIHAFLPSAGSARPELKITSEAAGTIIANSDSLFSVVPTSESIRVLCIRGELNWSKAAGSIVAGFYCDWKFKGATPEILPASEDAAAQREVIAALDSAQHIEELETAARNAPAPWRKH